MKALMITAMYPTPERPFYGTFVRTQVESLKQAGVDVEVLVLQGRSHKLMYPKGIVQMRRRLAEGTADLVHAHYGLVGMVARMQWRVPVVVTYHGDDLLGTRDPNGNITFESKVIVVAGQILGKYVDAVIVQSQEMARKLRHANVHVIPHEVDFDLFAPRDREQARAVLELDLEKTYLLFAADPRIPVKRFPLARAVADQLRRQDPSIEFLVVHQEPQHRLALYLNACDALVFTSYQEGSPNVIKQAMACNLPIAATDVGDVRQIIAGTPGCYVCSPDVSEFTMRLTEILRQRQRTNGRAQIQHLACPAVAQQVIGVYEETLRKHRAGRRKTAWQFP
ncbi:MAG: hypothetical protein JWO59_1526 [Chloroflexi bacterium]|nr:hypothetical protein [Chloroflexota bacterium]